MNDKDCRVSECSCVFVSIVFETPLADKKVGTVSLAKALEVGGRFSLAYQGTHCRLRLCFFSVASVCPREEKNEYIR